jgi:tRNA pseudouridine13 synthase
MGGDVKLKRLLARHWGRWEACARIARGPLYGRLFQHLAARPDDFAGALALLPTRLKLIHAFAYQSWLWNRAVDAVLRRLLPPRQVLLPTRAGQLLAWDGASPGLLRRLQDMAAPLFAPGGETGDPDFAAATAELLAREGLERRDAAVGITGMELRAEPRAVVLYPRDLVVGEPQADELAPGLRKVELSFGLPRGAYATLVVKRLLAKRAAAGRGRERPEGGGRGSPSRGGQRGAPRL